MSHAGVTRSARLPLKSCSGFSRADLLASTAVAGVLLLSAVGAASHNQAGTYIAACLANVRALSVAFHEYTTDRGYFPPNPDDGNTTPGYAWVGGTAGIGGAQEFNSDIVQDPSRSLLYRYLREQNAQVFRCPADPRTGRYSGSDPALRSTIVPAARSYVISQAVGTDPYTPGDIPAPVHGYWLDNNHTHARGRTWRTYSRFEDVVDPAPDRLAVFLEEDAASINDGSFAFGMQNAEWIDWPATQHDSSGTLGFADGHVEVKRWIDPRTAVLGLNVVRRSVPDSPDYEWLRARISALIRP